jgi:RNA recognition motif-containing protein
MDRATGRPRGIAFVELSTGQEVQAAIEKFDGYDLGGRSLRVNEARDRAPRAPRFTESGGPSEGSFGGGRKGRPKGSRRNARAKKRSL